MLFRSAAVDAARDDGADPGEASDGAAGGAACAAQVGGGVGLLPAARRGARAHAVPQALGQSLLGPQEDRRLGEEEQPRRRRRRRHRRGDAGAAAARVVVVLGHARGGAAREAAAASFDREVYDAIVSGANAKQLSPDSGEEMDLAEGDDADEHPTPPQAIMAVPISGQQSVGTSTFVVATCTN